MNHEGAPNSAQALRQQVNELERLTPQRELSRRTKSERAEAIIRALALTERENQGA